MPDPFAEALKSGGAIAIMLIVAFFLICGAITH